MVRLLGVSYFVGIRGNVRSLAYLCRREVERFRLATRCMTKDDPDRRLTKSTKKYTLTIQYYDLKLSTELSAEGAVGLGSWQVRGICAFLLPLL